ncbi:Hypothetical predicted protein [Olea europaea subsp. europaea]|uniref:Uncharacterized protein n=1 Tax=Olea europaea subsp. europaea TaxID=158383 RepID=A0A8S0TU65_OLEEU|nr:Hypothetical predicted protein [Olea europaea subsp. europaea]
MSGTPPSQVGTQPDFQAFLGNLWVKSEKCHGHGRVGDATGFSGISRQFSRTWCAGHDWDAFGRDNDVTYFSGIFGEFLRTVYKPRSGRVLVAVGTQPDFQAFVGIFGDSKCSPCSSLIWAAAMSRMLHGHILILTYFYAFSWTRCAGNARHVVRATAGIQPDFQALVGSFWDTVCRPCPGCGYVRDASMPGRDAASIFMQLVDMVCCPRLRRILAVTETQPDFQAFLGNFWDVALRPSHYRNASGPRQGRNLIFRHFWLVFGHDVQGAFRMPPSRGISRQFQEHGVQAMFGTSLDRGRDAVWFSGISRQFLGHSVQAMSRMLGTHPDFHVFLCNILDTVYRSCQGHVRTTAGMELDFQVIPSSFWGWCAGHVRDASWPGNVRDVATMQPDFQAFLGNFLDTVCWPCQAHQAMSEKRLSHGRDAAWFSGISRQFLGHGVQAMSRML